MSINQSTDVETQRDFCNETKVLLDLQAFMGPALSSLVAPQVVLTTSGAARGGRVGFMAALDCSMFNVYSALTIYLFSHPSFIQNSVRCSIARS